MATNISGTTRVCAVIGDPVEHSLSPRMHNAAFQALGLDYVYVAFHVKDVPKAVEGLVGFGIRGLSVTIPHKVSIMPYLDEITPLARRIGAVNTVINENGRLIGTNTDGVGALRALESVETVDGRTIALLGVGGAARGVAFTLASERKPKRIYLLHRREDQEMARSMLSDLVSHSSVPVTTAELAPDDTREIFKEADFIIHTTPVGMSPKVDECLVEEAWFSERHIVFDLIYNPAKTQLLQRAERRFARILNGVPMFVNQGAEQFRLWTGQEPPVEIMRQAVESGLGYT
ncbi:MAG: shikimate dehydrogenase [Candidatus Omnitrophica bacterium]|nr:shikimate dehydrogenase [Candidatus Omnitrophota bacterium]HPO99765.1 shikimate dehydrogenase [bacterium]